MKPEIKLKIAAIRPQFFRPYRFVLLTHNSCHKSNEIKTMIKSRFRKGFLEDIKRNLFKLHKGKLKEISQFFEGTTKERKRMFSFFKVEALKRTLLSET